MEIAQGIYRLEGEIDATFHLPAIYLIKGKRRAIVETGPASLAPRILQALGELGWDRDEVKYLIPNSRAARPSYSGETKQE